MSQMPPSPLPPPPQFNPQMNAQDYVRQTMPDLARAASSMGDEATFPRPIVDLMTRMLSEQSKLERDFAKINAALQSTSITGEQKRMLEAQAGEIKLQLARIEAAKSQAASEALRQRTESVAIIEGQNDQAKIAANTQKSETLTKLAFNLEREKERINFEQEKVNEDRLISQRDQMVRQARGYYSQGPQSAQMQTLLKELKEGAFKDVGGPILAAQVERDAQAALLSATSKQYFRSPIMSQFEANGLTPPTLEDAMAKQASGQSVQAWLREELSRGLKEKTSADTQRSFKEQVLDYGKRMGLPVSESLVIAETLAPKVLEEVRPGVTLEAAQGQVHSKVRTGGLKKAGIGAVAGLAAIAIGSKLFGKSEPQQQMDPMQQMQLMQMMQQARGGKGEGGAAPNDIVDMNRMVTLLKGIQALSAMQGGQPAMSGLV